MRSEETRNLLLAIVLSLMVLLGWNYFYGAPQLQRDHQAQTQPNGAPPLASGANAPQNAAPAAAQVRTRSEALAATKRVPIETSSLGGSVNLTGGLIDDLNLKGYRETTDPKSPTITLLSPEGGPDPYLAEAGYVSDASAKLTTPNRNTVWTSDGEVLTAAKPLTLTWDNGEGLTFVRKISVDEQFMFKITNSVENKSTGAVVVRPYGLVLRRGKPNVAGYAVLHEGFLGVIGDAYQEITYANIEKEAQKRRTVSGEGGWLGFTDKYWAAVVIPDQKAAIEANFSATPFAQTLDYQTDFVGQPQTIAPGDSAESTARIFAGAKEVATINRYFADYSIRKFNLMIDWGYFWFITQPLFRLMDFIFKFTGNFGVAILTVTVLVKLAFFPLANRSYLSMAKMKKVQPQIAALKELYPDDRAKQQQAQMELFKKEGVNPVAGCLPMVVQIPVFFALYKVIFITIEMRHAPFFGWIHDLSAPDPTNIFTLFGLIPWNPTALPLFGHFLALGIWPLVMGVSMFFQMKMNPEPADPVQKTMFAWMPVIFTFMLGTFPVGLVIYWTWNNTLTVLQQYYIMSKAGVKVELWDNLTKMFS
jgi:YidC/Oxa1 family membrane protein insertase